MGKAILVTGVAGTGKSSVSFALRRLGYAAYDIEAIPGLFSIMHKETGLPHTEHSNDDLELIKQGDWICDTKKLKQMIEHEDHEVAFYCGIAGNIDDLWKLFDKSVVLNTSDEVLLQRLGTRKKGEFANTNDVQQWVLSGKAWFIEKCIDQGALAIKAEGSPEEVAERILAALNLTGPAAIRSWRPQPL